MMRCLALIFMCITFAGAASADDAKLYTSTRYITDLAFSADGSLWAATRGGVLRRGPDGSWRKFTTADGLPSDEARGITTYINSDSVLITFPESSALWSDGRWTEKQTVEVGSALRSSIDQAAVVPESSTGSHVSDLYSYDGREIAAIFGDGLYEYIDDKWKRMNIDVPEDVREQITAIAFRGGDIWIGTRRAGIWHYSGKSWTQHLQPDEPYDSNIQSITLYRGITFFSTLEDGLVVRGPDGWRHVSPPEISSSAPRQMAEFGGSLYVRHGSGKVDRFDGGRWHLDVFSDLPRKQVSAIASDADRLYVGQWGGWSEFDGKSWTHHLKHSELQGCAITAILPDEDTVWIGTQGRGLAQYIRTSGDIRMHDERHGLADDWIKCLARVGETIYAGTFVSGLFVLEGSGWAQVPGIDAAEITCLSSDSSGSLFIATRTGAFARSVDGTIHRLEPRASEIQALCSSDSGLWLGSRTGIWLLR